jgi:release factor glutamine methyltransferase
MSLQTVGEVLRLSAQYLKNHGISRSRRIAEEFLAHLLQLERIQLYMQFDHPLEEKELVLLRSFLKRKVKGEPMEYILQRVHFFNCSFEITPAVLIPRPETEILVDKVYHQLSSLELKGKRCWDLCTGSGCIGISLKKALPELHVSLADLSEEALAIAEKNSQHNGVDLSLHHGDLLHPFHGQRADFIICNPPYVSEADYLQLDAEVKNFEPRQALVGGKTGLEFYKRLAEDLPHYLVKGGKVFFEIGAGQGSLIKELFSQDLWKERWIERDWSGHERFLLLTLAIE